MARCEARADPSFGCVDTAWNQRGYGTVAPQRCRSARALPSVSGGRNLSSLMKSVTPPQHSTRRGQLDARRRGASVLAGVALLPFVLIGLAVAGLLLAVGLIWAAAWAVVIAIAGAFAVAGVAAAVAIFRTRAGDDVRRE